MATKSLSSPFGYNDCDTSQYINYSQPTHQQPSSSSNVLNVNMTMERDSSGSDAQPNSDGIFNRLNQYPLPMPPLPPNVQLPYQTVAPTTIGEIKRNQWQFYCSKDSFVNWKICIHQMFSLIFIDYNHLLFSFLPFIIIEITLKPPQRGWLSVLSAKSDDS